MTHDEPVISIVHGNPTPEEIAAVTLAVLSRRRAAAGDDQETGGGWAGYWRRTRTTLRPGPDAWRLSLRG